MKTRIIPILALLVLAIITMIPADKIKMPNFGKLRSAFSSNSGNANNSYGGGGGLGGIVGNRNGRGMDNPIQYLNENVRYRTVRPGRHDENDHWGYDNKYYRKVDRGYQLNMFDDLKLENKNIRGLLGRSKVDINLYNKGLFNSGYGSVEVLVISYDEYGDYLGERIEVMPHCICKSEDARERLAISRNTDEVIVKILHAQPCTCRDWYEKANRKKERVQKKVNEEVKREQEKQYKKWERRTSRENKDAQRGNNYDSRQTSSNRNNQYSDRRNTYDRNRESLNKQYREDRERESSGFFPLFGRNRERSSNQNTRTVVYDDYNDYDYEEPKRKKQKKQKRICTKELLIYFFYKKNIIIYDHMDY